jgi:hypothetical protein
MPQFDLSSITTREALYPLYRQAHPDDTSNVVIGQQVGQIARFLLEIQAGDYVITPAADTEWLHYGEVGPDPSYEYAVPEDGCHYRHRRRVRWAKKRLSRGDFSVPFQNTIRSSLTVFAISQRDEFLEAIGRTGVTAKPSADYDPYRAFWNRSWNSIPRSSRSWLATSSPHSVSKAPRSRAGRATVGSMPRESSTWPTSRRSRSSCRPSATSSAPR